jgi:thiol:disulfide interchange protein
MPRPVPLTALALWLTLFALNAFPANDVYVRWEKSWNVATARALAEGKPLIVDVWADWCAACKEMDANLWNRPDVAETLNSQFVALKLDFTEESEESRRLAKDWNLGGLPAVGFYRDGDNFSSPPAKLFREKVSHEVFLDAVLEIDRAKR